MEWQRCSCQSNRVFFEFHLIFTMQVTVVNDSQKDGSLKWDFVNANGPYEVGTLPSRLCQFANFDCHRHTDSTLCKTYNPILTTLKWVLHVWLQLDLCPTSLICRFFLILACCPSQIKIWKTDGRIFGKRSTISTWMPKGTEYTKWYS